MLMLFLFPLALLASLAACVADAARARSFRQMRSGLSVILASLIASYCVGFAVVSLEPWFDDNGSPQFIEWRYRWAWAAEIAGWFAIGLLPTALGVRALMRRTKMTKAGR